MAIKQVKKIGYLAFDGVQALDLFGPLESFQEANEILERDPAPYENVIISKDGQPVRTSSGVMINAHISIADCKSLHTLIIPGGEGARLEEFPQETINWITQLAPRLNRFGSVCTGLFILAKTGLLDRSQVTTHWKHIQEAQIQFPKLDVKPDALFLRSGRTFTAAGVTAGIDLTLALIEEDFGHVAASEVARHLVVFLKRPGDQRQFSSALMHQSTSRDEFSELIAWITDNLKDDLSSFALAERVGLSERQFRRKFAQIYTKTPVKFIEQIRIQVAISWLTNERISIEAIAADTGFASADSFRRAFERQMGITPSTYRDRFSRVAQ